VYRDQDTVDIHLQDDSVSRHHAAIVHHTTGKVYVIDLDSVRHCVTILIALSVPHVS
jgi:pSer/pThr/pTyr-binding forkhead associated (FHA) protein